MKAFKYNFIILNSFYLKLLPTSLLKALMGIIKQLKIEIPYIE